MDGTHVQAIRQALETTRDTVANLPFSTCDQDDVQELIERVSGELRSDRPNVPLMCTFLNSIARSLRAEPEARRACLAIEEAIRTSGMPSTWQAGL